MSAWPRFMASDRNTELSESPESATNRPSRARLLAEGGTVRGARSQRRSSERSIWLMLGVMLGVLICQVIDLWRAVEAAR